MILDRTGSRWYPPCPIRTEEHQLATREGFCALGNTDLLGNSGQTVLHSVRIHPPPPYGSALTASSVEGEAPYEVMALTLAHPYAPRLLFLHDIQRNIIDVLFHDHGYRVFFH